jgi:putative sigma-54 modulation protein
MNVTITFRHMDPSDSIKAYATAKVSKLQKLLRQPMTARVTVALDKLQHSVEVQLSSGSHHAEAKEVSEDTYASIDAVMDKLERQLRESKEASQSRRRRSGETLRSAQATQPEAPVAMASGGSKKAAGSAALASGER